MTTVVAWEEKRRGLSRGKRRDACRQRPLRERQRTLTCRNAVTKENQALSAATVMNGSSACR
ncbi:MAG TPA: hypothetical protein VM820_05430, partial [Vicinamibacterales bacterium]|nr:hypothetical protein [Vicinamibacterales bacterium]